MKAILRRARISPRKANLVAGMVRGKKVEEALELLKFMPKRAAGLLYQVVNSAASNAKNNFKQPLSELFITKLLVTKGPTLKRWLPVSRGRSHPILKRTSHITVEVGVSKKDSARLPTRQEDTPSAHTYRQAGGDAGKQKTAKKVTERKATAPKKATVKARKSFSKTIKGKKT